MERALGRLMGGIERVLAFALLAIIALNFAKVVGRYALGRTLVGGDEVQTCAMVWIAFIGARLVAWRGEPDGADSVVDRTRQRGGRTVAGAARVHAHTAGKRE